MIEFKKYYLSENISLPSLAFAKWSTVVTPLLDLWGVPRPKQLTTFGNTLYDSAGMRHELQTCKILMSVLNEKQIILGIIQVGLT